MDELTQMKAYWFDLEMQKQNVVQQQNQAFARINQLVQAATTKTEKVSAETPSVPQ